jgi:hypothetical protein
MLATQPLIGWLCVAILAALVARSLTRLAIDFAGPSSLTRAAARRAGALRRRSISKSDSALSRGIQSDRSAPACARTSRVGEALHAAMALGMAAMVIAPVTSGVAYALEAYFGIGAAVEGGVWAARAMRRRTARLRGGVVSCRLAHSLELHHAVVGLAMVLMAAHMSGGATLLMSSASMDSVSMSSQSMASMPGMAAGPGGIGTALATLALLYIWVAVVVLGGGLAKSALAQPASPKLPAGLALLSAPVTFYACELTMTVVMGLMLLG